MSSEDRRNGIKELWSDLVDDYELLCLRDDDRLYSKTGPWILPHKSDAGIKNDVASQLSKTLPTSPNRRYAPQSSGSGWC